MQAGEKIVVSEQDFRRRFVYDQESLLGEGGFAKVYKAYDRQFEETVALKFYTKTDVQKYDIISEMRNSRRFTHKNVIRVHDACIVRFTNHYGITEDVQVGILEYANAGNLLDFLNSGPSEESFKQVMIGILQGLHYLHTEKRVIHRDLSPDNILMFKEQNTWIPKIADFGISKQIDLKTVNMGDKKVSSELVGKMEYMAPEQFDPNKYGINGKITTNVDLWSFGVILTEIFTETSPFGDRNTSQSPMQIMHNVLHSPLPSQIKSIPEPYRKVILNSLVKDARKRAQSSLELIHMLSTPIQKKKKNNNALVLSAVVVLILLSIGGWFLLKSEDNQAIAEDVSAKEDITPTPPNVGILPDDSAFTDNLNNGIPEDTVEKTPDETPKKKVPSAETPQKLPKKNANSLLLTKEALCNDLLREIKSLDNELVYTNLRMNRINRHIHTFFTNKDANVLIYEKGKVEEQAIEEFFKYVVNTAGMETRDWKINAAQTKLSGNKIATLSVEKIASTQNDVSQNNY